MTDEEQFCHDCGAPADLDQTMRFDDIGEPPIYWCTACGEQNNALNEVLQEKLKDPEFREKFALEIDKLKSGGVQ